MADNAFVDFIDRQQWLGWLGDVVAPLIGKAFTAAGQAGKDTKDFLNGVWLGHPLHPVLTDIPIGAWTAAEVFDVASAVSPNIGYERAASGAIWIGLVGAFGSAVTGLTDWSDTSGRARRTGLMHGLLNVTATALYVTSLVERARDRAGRGKAYGLLGYAIAAGSAYLGGDLVYTQQLGVDHAFGQEVPEQYTAVLHERELKEGRPMRVRVGETPVVLVRDGGRIRALADTCAHLGGPLSEGTVEDGTIVCPWHGSRYSLADGSIVDGPTTHPQPWYECRIRGGQVEVRMPREVEPAAAESEKKETLQGRAAS